MGLSPLIYEPETHIIYQNNTSFPYLSSDLCILLSCKNNYRDMTLKQIFQNFHNTFFNSDFSLYNDPNVTKLLGHVLFILLERMLSQNLDLGLGYFFMFCRNFVKVFFTIFYVSCHTKKNRA